jgi:hypothetical protein
MIEKFMEEHPLSDHQITKYAAYNGIFKVLKINL